MLISMLMAVALQADALPAEDRLVGKDEHKRYFLIGPAKDDKPPAEGCKLALVLPGGTGSADFHPFVRNVLAPTLGKGYVVAQLVSVMWTPGQEIIWPTDKTRAEGMKFTTEEFIEAVVKDVAAKIKIDRRFVFTLSWSSSGPACYAAALQEKTSITGSLVSMAVFVPDTLPPLNRARGRAFYIVHSEQDRTCPFRLAEQARDRLKKEGAAVDFATYEGGHGFHGDFRAWVGGGFRWLEKAVAPGKR